MGKIHKIKKHYQDYGFLNTISWLYNSILFKIIKLTIRSADFDSLKIKPKDLDYLTLKNDHNIFIVAGVPYYDIGGGQRCSQFAKTFNKMGFNVIYLYAFKSSESKIFRLEMPMSSHIFIDDKTVSKISEIVKKDDLFIFEAPSVRFNDILDLAIEKECKIVYENIDNWETSLGSTVYNEEMIIKLLKNSDLLVGTAKPLVDQLKEYLTKYKIKNKEVLYLANAVDDELFCGVKDLEKPSDLEIGEKTFLYYGTLWGKWFDWDLIFKLASKHKKYAFNMIGDYENIKDIVDRSPKNVHFLGLKKQVELPNYLKYVDYSMIPFIPGEIVNYVSPLKIFEYISMYTKVLCTGLPEVKNYPNVYTGNTCQEWEEIINDNKEVDMTAADNFVVDNTWSNRVSNIINAIYPEKNKSIFKDNLSIVILNYNNKNVIFKSLNTILKFNELYNYEIIVVDNGSVDGSYELLKEKYGDKIKLVKNSKNGCSSGRNLGVRLSTKKYLLFLDSDQWVTGKYWLSAYENILKTVDNVGLIGWAAGFFNSSRSAYHVVDSFPYRYMPSNSLCRYDIGYLGSGGMLVTKEDFDKVDGFDIHYDPTCYEDTDFSLKIRNTGKEIYYCPYLGIIHLPHQTTKSGSDEHTKLINEKKQYFTKKWEEKNIELLKVYKK